MPIPAEEFTGHGFDTAVCINVLEHVRDAKLVMENLVKCLKKGGVLIFHDRVYDGLDITKIYDIGHPIRITSKFLEPFLKQFTPLREWLNEHIHRRGKTYRANRLAEVVTGEPLSHKPLVRHLHAKFDELYNL